MKSKKTTVIKAILGLASIVNCTGADIIWPDDIEWNPLTQGTNFYYDAAGDRSPDAIDLTGTVDTMPAGYWALVEDGYDDSGVAEEAFMFRLRLSGDGTGRKYVWQAHLDIDGDASNTEWILQLVQSGKKANRRVELIQTEIGGPRLRDIDTGSNTSAWLGEIDLFSRWTAISGSSDYYVDIAIPWDTFTSITDVTELEQIRTVLSTSRSHTGIQGDIPLGARRREQISDVLSDNIPEPTVVSLLLGSGLGFLVFRRIFNRYGTENESPE